MKQIFSQILILILMQSCSSSENIPDKSDLEQAGLSSNVMSVLTKTFEAKDLFGEISKGKLIKYPFKKEYNEVGNIIVETSYNFNGEIDEKKIKEYDKQGNWTGRKRYDKNGAIEQSVILKYDNQNNLIEFSEYSSNGELGIKSVYVFNSENNQIEEYNLDSTGELYLHEKSSYDESDNKVSEIRYYSDGKKSAETISRFDSNNNEIESRRFGFTSTYPKEWIQTNKWIRKYKKKKCIEVFRYEGENKLISSSKYRYDTKDRETYTANFDSYGEIKNETRTEYNLKNDFTLYKSEKGDEYLYKYKYDNEGNFIYRLTYVNGLADNIIERKIEYR